MPDAPPTRAPGISLATASIGLGILSIVLFFVVVIPALGAARQRGWIIPGAAAAP